MSTRIGIRELRQHASRYLDMARAGERVEITDRGRLVAVLAPPDAEALVREELIQSERLTPGTGALAGWEPPVTLRAGVEPPSAVLARMRDAEHDDGPVGN